MMIRPFVLPLAALVLAGSVALGHPPQHHQPVKGSVGPPPPQRQGPPRTGDFTWPARIVNAKVLPADIGSDRLRQTMVGWSRALGVRCTYCHVGEEGAPLSRLDFRSDANPHKDMARGMVKMTERINEELLPAIPGLHAPRVTCATCHRGSPDPELPPPPEVGPPVPPGVQPPATVPPPPAHIAPDTPAKPH